MKRNTLNQCPKNFIIANEYKQIDNIDCVVGDFKLTMFEGGNLHEAKIFCSNTPSCLGIMNHNAGFVDCKIIIAPNLEVLQHSQKQVFLKQKVNGNENH